MQEFQAAFDAFRVDHSPQGRVLRAALGLVETMGLDKVTVAAILAEAKVARGTVYAHFGDVFGVLATAWSRLGPSWLRLLLTAPDDSEVPTAYRSALVQILCAARRAPVLDEVVAPDVAAAWEALDRSTPLAETRALWSLLLRLSIELSRTILPEGDTLTPLVGFVAALPADSLDRFGPVHSEPRESQLPPVLSPFDVETDDVIRRLMVAAVDVVATSGLDAASMLRVCRTARLTPGAAAPRFADLRSLHEYAFSKSLADVVRQNAGVVSATLEGLSIPEQSAAITASSLQPTRRKWRLYRQEFQIAAMTDPELAATLREAFVATDEAGLEALLSTGADEGLARAMLLFTHVAAAGVGAVDSLGLPLAEVDSRPVFHWLFECFTGAPADRSGR